MLALSARLYNAALDQGDQFAVWGLCCLAAHVPMHSARWLRVPGPAAALAAIKPDAEAAAAWVCEKFCVAGVDGEGGHEFHLHFTEAQALDEGQRAWLHDALHMLVSAGQLARRLQQALAKARGDGSQTRGFAVVDEASGCVETADHAFGDYLTSACDRWDGERLPFTFIWGKKLAEHGMVYCGLYFHFELADGKYRLWTRPDRRGPVVSAREMEVACKLSRGMSFKEIGRELNLAASTVSTHVYNLYEKLGIRRRVQLVEWVKAQPQH